MPRRHTEMGPEENIDELLPSTNIQDVLGRVAIKSLGLVWKRICNGTASSQETTTMLKYLTNQQELERQKLEAEIILAQAKVDALKNAANSEENQKRILKAMARYNGLDEEIIGDAENV